MASQYGDLRHLLPGNYKRLIADWLEEDCPSFDYGGFVVGESEGEARLLGKSEVTTTTTTHHIPDTIHTNIISTHRVSSQAFPSSTKSSPN